MPNWVRNEIETTKDVLEALINDKGDVDFSRIVSVDLPHPEAPAPVQFKRTAGKLFQSEKESKTEVSLEEFRALPKESQIATAKSILVKSDGLDIEHVTDDKSDLLIQYAENVIVSGFSTWYEFHISKWGTKWNACESYPLGSTGYQFETAWECPHPIFQALQKKFPNLNLKVKWADEDIGINCGFLEIEDGKLITFRRATYGDDKYTGNSWFLFAIDVWKYDISNFLDLSDSENLAEKGVDGYRGLMKIETPIERQEVQEAELLSEVS